jgi:hypothetical protein
MSTKSGIIRGHRFGGDPKRFEVVAAFIADKWKGKVKTVADVGGGQGMLARILQKKYGFTVDVIDPRGYTLTGVNSREEEYKSTMAPYYDLVVGLHPDEALKEVVYSAKVRPILVIPCCNFWSREEKLGCDALLEKIESYLTQENIPHERIIFDFEGPKNIGIGVF